MPSLVACGNEPIFGVNYSVTFAALIAMSSVKIILVLARKWGVTAKHGDVPNAYVKADQEADLDNFMHVPSDMTISEEIRKGLGVGPGDVIVLELKKALYGLQQAGRLWRKLLHSKLKNVGFYQSLVDMCVYYRHKDGEFLVAGVYVDVLLVAGSAQSVVYGFFGELVGLSVKNLGETHKFLCMRVTYDENEGYELDQEVTIEDLLKEHGMEFAHGVRVPVGKECNGVEESRR